LPSVKLVYDEGYDLHLGAHVFPSSKFKLIHDRLIEIGAAAPTDFSGPEPATDDDLRLVHNAQWIRRLHTGLLTFEEVMRLEIPYSQAMVHGFWMHAGGSILAGRLALEHKIAFNCGGGFHHAFPDHGEGFCAVNDVGTAIRRLQTDKLIERALVVDCDVHHGNGTAAMFAGDPTVFTFSIHQFNNYPSEKPPSDIDVHLEDGVGDDEYLIRLAKEYVPAVRDFKPDLIFYVAGADPYFDDQLGGLSLTMAGLRRRDDLVIQTALAHNASLAITLAGGYARQIEDTVEIHAATAQAATAALA
jgi:acetoin utilization deacetylase AcuC-like enzyme